MANHLQCDHVKGIRTHTDLTPRVSSLSSNVELLTAIANDLGYEMAFSFQLESQSQPGDVLVAISSSGRSPNIVRALLWAHNHGMQTIVLTGFDGGMAREIADVALHVDCDELRDRRGPPSIDHAHPGSVHSTEPDDRRVHRLPCLLNL